MFESYLFAEILNAYANGESRFLEFERDTDERESWSDFDFSLLSILDDIAETIFFNQRKEEKESMGVATLYRILKSRNDYSLQLLPIIFRHVKRDFEEGTFKALEELADIAP